MEFLLLFPIAALVGIAYMIGIVVGGKRSRPKPVEFVRRPIEPREDATIVTRDPSKRRGHSRVSTAHLSQPRRGWNHNSEES